jgi:hypothetical protein
MADGKLAYQVSLEGSAAAAAGMRQVGEAMAGASQVAAQSSNGLKAQAQAFADNRAARSGLMLSMIALQRAEQALSLSGNETATTMARVGSNALQAGLAAGAMGGPYMGLAAAGVSLLGDALGAMSERSKQAEARAQAMSVALRQLSRESLRLGEDLDQAKDTKAADSHIGRLKGEIAAAEDRLYVSNMTPEKEQMERERLAMLRDRLDEAQGLRAELAGKEYVGDRRKRQDLLGKAQVDIDDGREQSAWRARLDAAPEAGKLAIVGERLAAVTQEFARLQDSLAGGGGTRTDEQFNEDLARYRSLAGEINSLEEARGRLGGAGGGEERAGPVYTDALTRIGMLTGGGGLQLDHGKRTATATEQSARSLARIEAKVGAAGGAAWA